jgi:hypothetical protein
MLSAFNYPLIPYNETTELVVQLPLPIVNVRLDIAAVLFKNPLAVQIAPCESAALF